MKTPASKCLQAGVLTIGILAAVAASSQAHAWGSRGGGSFAGRADGSADSSGTVEEREAAAQGKWKARPGRLKNASGQATASTASSDAQAPAAGGWRQKLQQQSAAGTSGKRSGAYATNNGGSGTFTQDYTRGQGASTRDNTVTNAKGDTKGWTTQQSVTHGDGAVTGSTTVTGDNGKTHSGNTTLNTNTDTLTKTTTGANGQTHGVTLQGDGTTGDGDRTGSYTTQSGRTGTYDQKVSYSDGAVTRDTTVTNASGQTAGWTTQKTAASSGGVTTAGTTVTGQNGKTESWDTTYDKNTGTLEHTYTASGGQQYGGTVTFNK